MRSIRYTLLATTLYIAAGTSLVAQTRDSASTSSPAIDTFSARPGVWNTHRDLVAIAGVMAATALTMPFDNSVKEEFRDPGPQRSTFLHRSASFFNTAGDPGTLITSIAMYGVGRVSHSYYLTQLGEHASEAVIASGMVTGTIKILAGRNRPNVPNNDADDFAFGHGRSGAHQSFPSGHTTAAFAFASSVSADVRAWNPRVGRIATPILYGGAAMVGFARMYGDDHWASDVVLGAGIGTIIGNKTVKFARTHPNNWIARQLETVTITPLSNGMTLGVSLKTSSRS